MDGQEDSSLSQWCTEVDRLRLGERERRRRAPRACQKCRSRKVRCDVAMAGIPCFHCKLDGVNCKIANTKRGSSCKVNVSIKDTAAGPESRVRSTTSCRGGWRNTPVALKESEQEPAPLQVTGPDIDGIRACEQPTHADKPHTIFPETQDADDAPGYFIRPPPPHLTSEDCGYIRVKRCMELFELEFHQALLEAYIQYVFPILPILDIQTVSSTVILGPQQRQPIGLCLLQSVYLLGALYAPVHSLRQQIFSSRSEALSTIYSRLKLLTDMDYQHDTTESLQVALHMILYFRESQETLMEHKWLITAIGLEKLKIYHQQDSSGKNVSATTALWRRLEWALYVLQDGAPLSLHGISMRGRPNIPAITQEDFDFSALGYPHRKILFGNTLASISEIEEQFAASCASFAALRSIIFSVYTYDHMLLKECQSTKSDHTQVSVLTAAYSDAEKQLHEWMRSMPSDFQVGPRHICPKQRSGRSTIQRVQYAVMYVTWYNLCRELERRMAKVTIFSGYLYPKQLNPGLRRLRENLDAAGSALCRVVLQRHRLSQLHCTECRMIFQSLNASGMERRLSKETNAGPQPSLLEPADAYMRLHMPISSCQANLLNKPLLSPAPYCTSMRDWLTAISTPESVTDDFASKQNGLPYCDHIIIPTTPIISEQEYDRGPLSPDFEQYLDTSQIEGPDFELFPATSTILDPPGFVSVC